MPDLSTTWTRRRHIKSGQSPSSGIYWQHYTSSLMILPEAAVPTSSPTVHRTPRPNHVPGPRAGVLRGSAATVLCGALGLALGATAARTTASSTGPIGLDVLVAALALGLGAAAAVVLAVGCGLLTVAAASPSPVLTVTATARRSRAGVSLAARASSPSSDRPRARPRAATVRRPQPTARTTAAAAPSPSARAATSTSRPIGPVLLAVVRAAVAPRARPRAPQSTVAADPRSTPARGPGTWFGLGVRCTVGDDVGTAASGRIIRDDV